MALSRGFVVKLIHWIRASLDGFLALKCNVVINVVCLASICATLGGCVVIVIVGATIDALLGH